MDIAIIMTVVFFLAMISCGMICYALGEMKGYNDGFDTAEKLYNN